jgi:hypothetical protein
VRSFKILGTRKSKVVPLFSFCKSRIFVFLDQQDSGAAVCDVEGDGGERGTPMSSSAFGKHARAQSSLQMSFVVVHRSPGLPITMCASQSATPFKWTTNKGIAQKTAAMASMVHKGLPVYKIPPKKFPPSVKMSLRKRRFSGAEDYWGAEVAGRAWVATEKNHLYLLAPPRSPCQSSLNACTMTFCSLDLLLGGGTTYYFLTFLSR